jgi:hypothetical protein
MAYTTPPVFADDEVLSASALNVLSENIAYLYGLARMVNIPFAYVTLGLNYQESTYIVRHRARYLYVTLNWSNDPTWVDHLNTIVTYNAVEIYNDDLTGTSSATLELDLDPLTLTVGDFYEIIVKTQARDDMGDYQPFTGSTFLQLRAMYEVD